jgi:hypothetical protein
MLRWNSGFNINEKRGEVGERERKECDNRSENKWIKSNIRVLELSDDEIDRLYLYTDVMCDNWSRLSISSKWSVPRRSGKEKTKAFNQTIPNRQPIIPFISTNNSWSKRGIDLPKR